MATPTRGCHRQTVQLSGQPGHAPSHTWCDGRPRRVVGQLGTCGNYQQDYCLTTHVSKSLANDIGCNSNGGQQKAHQNGGLPQPHASGTWQQWRTRGWQRLPWPQSNLGQLLLVVWVQGIAYQKNLQCDWQETGTQWGCYGCRHKGGSGFQQGLVFARQPCSLRVWDSFNGRIK